MKCKSSLNKPEDVMPTKEFNTFTQCLSKQENPLWDIQIKEKNNNGLV